MWSRCWAARALFCNGRLLPEEIPEGLYAYDLRYSDEKDSSFPSSQRSEKTTVELCMLRELLDFREQGHLSFTDDTSPNVSRVRPDAARVYGDRTGGRS